MEFPDWVSVKEKKYRKAKIVQKRKEQVVYFLIGTSRRQSGLLVYQITLKAYRMP